MIIEKIKSIVVTTYGGEDLHIHVRATELQQAFETDKYWKQLSSLCSIV